MTRSSVCVADTSSKSSSARSPKSTSSSPGLAPGGTDVHSTESAAGSEGGLSWKGAGHEPSLASALRARASGRPVLQVTRSRLPAQDRPKIDPELPLDRPRIHRVDPELTPNRSQIVPGSFPNRSRIELGSTLRLTPGSTPHRLRIDLGSTSKFYLPESAVDPLQIEFGSTPNRPRIVFGSTPNLLRIDPDSTIALMATSPKRGR